VTAPCPPAADCCGVYRERARLVAYLARVHPAVWHTDDPDWPVVYISTPAGQLSWHINRLDLDLFPPLPSVDSSPWDGHDTDEKYARLHRLPLL